MAKQPGWMRVLQLIENENKPFTNASIQLWDEIDGKDVNVPWLSSHLWPLVCSNVTNDVFTHRVAFAGGEEYTGFELWRRLLHQREGGASEVALQGIRSLHGFPKCPRPDLMFRWIGTWQTVKNQHGSGLPDDHLKSMF